MNRRILGFSNEIGFHTIKMILMIRDLSDTLVSFAHNVRTFPYPFSFADPKLPLQIIYGIPEIEYPNIQTIIVGFWAGGYHTVYNISFEDLMESPSS